MNGILNILKPPGMTSFDVVAYLRRITGIRKIGHMGTLDPGAAGVLPVCMGRATRALEYLTEKDKEYRAELTLGIRTDTQDSYGKITAVSSVSLTPEEICRVVESFQGRYLQIPPMYSAVRIKGKRLYELARDGITIERSPREVFIHSIKVAGISGDIPVQGKPAVRKVLFDVKCSKGTYIRTLCADIGEALGCGGHMSFLVRTKAGPFDILSAITLQDVSRFLEDGELERHIVGVDMALEGFGSVTLDCGCEKRFLNGIDIRLIGTGTAHGEIVKVYDCGRKFIGLGEVKLIQGQRTIRLKKAF